MRKSWSSDEVDFEEGVHFSFFPTRTRCKSVFYFQLLYTPSICRISPLFLSLLLSLFPSLPTHNTTVKKTKKHASIKNHSPIERTKKRCENYQHTATPSSPSSSSSSSPSPSRHPSKALWGIPASTAACACSWKIPKHWSPAPMPGGS